MLKSILNYLINLFKSSGDSGKIAKHRIELVLLQDRANCQGDIGDIIEALKNEIIQVIKKYVELDGELNIEIFNKNDATVSILSANIPIKKRRKASVN